MTMQVAFDEVSGRLEDCARAVESIRWAVVEGRVAAEEHALATRLENVACDLSGWLCEARAALVPVRSAALGSDLNALRQSLAQCQQRINEVARSFNRDAFSLETLRALDQLRCERGQWQHWADGVEDALEHSREPLDALQRSLVECWQELSEKASGITVSVRTDATGQVHGATQGPSAS